MQFVRKLASLFVGVFCVTPLVNPAIAQNCGDLQTQLEMNDCAGQSFKRSDAELNLVYNDIRTRLASEQDTLDLLVAAQRGWIVFRDAECAFSTSGVKTGSVYPLIHAICLDQLTQDRIADLKHYLSCAEGDMSCPVPWAN